MRRTVPIILLVLGVLCALVGIGRLTFWGPSETLTAHTSAQDTKAPLTMIKQPVQDLAGDGAKLTVHADGKFRAVIGRDTDVEAWVGDSAATVINGVDQEDESFRVQQRPGRSSSPNPTGSDLWVVDEEHQGDWTATWSSEKSGDQDTWTPPANGKWTMLLATDGNSAAPTDLSLTWDNPDATFAAKFAKAVWWFIAAVVLIAIAIVLFSRRPRRRSRHGAGTTIESPRRAARGQAESRAASAAPAGLTATSATPEPRAGDDDTIIRPLDLDGVEEETDVDDDDFDLPGGPAEEQGPTGAGPGRRRRLGRGVAVGLIATGLMLPSSPAFSASDAPKKEGSSKATPVMVDSQLQRIMGQVATAQTQGDKQRSTARLESRFSGPALQLRRSYYANVKKGVKDNSAVPAISADPIRASAVTTTAQWPRTIMVVSQGQNQSYPVISTLEQESPRSNYHVLQAVPMVAEAKLPGVTIGAPEVVSQTPDQDGLEAKPEAAVDGFADLLKSSRSKWAKKFDSSVFVDVWHQGTNSLVKQMRKADEDARFETSFSVDSSATKVLASPQGGSYVSADLTITTVASPSKGGTMGLPGDAKKLAGVGSTSKKVVTRYHVPTFLYIPAAGDGKIRVIGATQQLKGIELK